MNDEKRSGRAAIPADGLQAALSVDTFATHGLRVCFTHLVWYQARVRADFHCHSVQGHCNN